MAAIVIPVIASRRRPTMSTIKRAIMAATRPTAVMTLVYVNARVLYPIDFKKLRQNFNMMGTEVDEADTHVGPYRLISWLPPA